MSETAIFRIDRRRQPRDYVTAQQAAELYQLAESRADSNLEGDASEFWFWEPGRAVRCHVYAIGADQVPKEVRARLQAVSRPVSGS